MSQNPTRTESKSLNTAKVIDLNEETAVERNCKLIDSYIIESSAKPSSENPRVA